MAIQIMKINDLKSLDELQFAKIFQQIRDRILKDPIENFVKAKNLINFNPTPAQTVALKCIFGKELDGTKKYDIYKEDITEDKEFDLSYRQMTEIELFEYMTGQDYAPNDIEKNRINLIVGRRGGKSTISAIVAIFSMLKVDWKPFLTKTPVATVLVLSHSVEFSEEVLDILRQMVEESPLLSMLKDSKRKDTQRIFHLKVPFIKKRKDSNEEYVSYSRVRVKVGAASKKTTRGSAVCTLLCDEIAFWNLAETAAESDADILRAVRPALLQFGEHGTIIKLSSPGIKQGELYNEWNRKEELKNYLIQFKAPSWVWNTILPAEEFKKEWRIDPDGFDTEYRANFVDSISNFILPEYVDMAVMRNVKFNPPSEDKNTTYSAAIDAAFKSDKFAFALVGHNEKRVTTYVLKYWEGSKNNPVKAHEVAKYIRTVCAEYGISEVDGDQYSYQPLREIFEQYGIRLVENTFSIPYKRKIYFALKRLFHNQQIDLPDIPLLSKEIKELQVEQTPTGQVKIGHPQGGSDDLADALGVACHRVLEKAGSAGIAGEMALSGASKIKTDLKGRAFTAPSVDMLSEYAGFSEVVDNSKEYARDPKTGKLRKVSEMEEEEALPGSTGGNFIF